MKGRGTSKKNIKSLDSNQELLKKIGARLKHFRQMKGYTAAEYFAYEHEIARAQYALYEKGADMRITSLSKVLKAMGVTLAEFFSDFD